MRSTAKKLSEAEVTRQVVDYLKVHGWFPIRLQSGIFSRPGAPGRISIGMKGLPDYIAVRPNRVLFLEMKATGQKTAPAQDVFIENLQHQNFDVIVADSFEAFESRYKDVMDAA